MRNPDSCGPINLLDGNKQPCPSYTTLQAYIAAHPPAMHVAGTTAHRRPQRLRAADEPARLRHDGDRALLDRRGRDADAQLPAAGDEPHHAARADARASPASSRASRSCPRRTDLPIWIEHADYWNNNKAGRLSQGTGERSDTWYFAEGVVGGTYWKHDNTAYNPSATDAVRVTWQFMNASGTLAQVTHDMAPRGSHRVRVNDVPGIEGEHATLVQRRVGRGRPAGANRRRADDRVGQRHRGPLDPRRAVPVADLVLRRRQPGRTVVDVPAADEPVRSAGDGRGALPAGERAVAALHLHRAAAAPLHGGAADHRRVRHRRAIGRDRRRRRGADHRRARDVLRPAVEHRPCHRRARRRRRSAGCSPRDRPKAAASTIRTCCSPTPRPSTRGCASISGSRTAASSATRSWSAPAGGGR